MSLLLSPYYHYADTNVHKKNSVLLGVFFFSRNVVYRGEIAFVGRENMKNIQKTNFVIVWGGELKPWGGEFLTLKALKKTLVSPVRPHL